MGRNDEVQTMPRGEQVFNTAAEAINQGHTIQAMQTPFATAVAVQKPRSLPQVLNRCLDEAAILAEDSYYSWGAGKDRVEGPSIELAKVAARNWGNCAVIMKPAQVTPQEYIFTAAFVDLETGFTIDRQFRQSRKWTVYGKFDEERKEDIRFQIGQSKAIRNVILSAMPGWLVTKMMEEAKAGVRAGLEKYIEAHGIEAAQDLVVKRLSKHRVTLDRIEMKMGKKVRGWEIEDLIVLRGDVEAIEKGAEEADALFPLEQQAETLADVAASAGKPKSQRVAQSIQRPPTRKPEPEPEPETEPDEDIDESPDYDEVPPPPDDDEGDEEPIPAPAPQKKPVQESARRQGPKAQPKVKPAPEPESDDSEQDQGDGADEEEAMRKEIRLIASNEAAGDNGFYQQIINTWTRNKPLDDVTGPQLHSVLSLAMKMSKR